MGLWILIILAALVWNFWPSVLFLAVMDPELLLKIVAVLAICVVPLGVTKREA